MTSLRYEDVVPDAAAFLALVRGRVRVPGVPSLDEAARVAAARELPRGALSDAVTARLRALDAPPESIAAAERLREPGVVAVVAGQQPVLFGGPHLVVAKALAAVAWSRRLEASGRPCVPVFWVASEDHDHAEVDHVSVLAADGALERISVRLPHDRRMLSRVALPAETSAAMDRLAACLPSGPGRDDALAAAQVGAGDTVGRAFSRTILRLLGRFGLVVVEPETLRPFATQVASVEIQRPGAMAAAITESEAALVAQTGGAPPLGLRRPELIFAVEDGVRVAVERVAGGFLVGGRLRTPENLLARLREDPGSYSWNVAARVVAQNAALPVAAQVCGPAELVYCSVLADAHVVAGVPMPALLSRPGLTLVEARTVARCTALGTTAEAVVRAGLSEALQPASGSAAETAALSGIRRLAADLPPGSGPAARRRRAAFLRQLDLYEAAIVRERQVGSAAADARRRRVLDALRPSGGLQERELSILPFLARHGAAMLDRLLDVLGRPGAEHELVLLAGE